MKKFIAISSAGGNSTSGVQTKNDALAWAQKIMGQHHNVSHVFLCEVIEVVERAEPPITVKAFQPEVAVVKAA